MAQQPQQRALFGNGSGGGPTARSVASTHSRRSSSPCALLKRCVRACLFFSLCLAQSDCALLVLCALSAVLGSISLCFARALRALRCAWLNLTVLCSFRRALRALCPSPLCAPPLGACLSARLYGERCEHKRSMQRRDHVNELEAVQ